MKVSIITVCYNSERTIEETIKSVLNQSYKDIEYIIVDGNSKDNTLKIVKEYEKKFMTRLKWISESDKGLYDAMNKGIALATGEIIGIINSDDTYVDVNVISKVVDRMQDSDGLYADLEFVDEKDTSIVVRRWIAGHGKFTRGWNPPHPTVFLKKSVYEKYGKYNEDFKISSDYDLLLRCMYNNKIRMVYLNEFIVRMRMGGESTRGLRSTIQGSKEVYISLKHNKIRYPMLIVFWRLIRKVKQLV